MLAKRRPGTPRGELVWHDTLVWIGAERLRLDPERPVPLIVFPPPGITRARALEALERAGPAPGASRARAASLNGLIAAARAGLGVMAHTRGLIPPGLVPVPSTGGPAGARATWTSCCCTGAGGTRAQGAADALAAAILAGGDRSPPRPGRALGTPDPA